MISLTRQKLTQYAYQLLAKRDYSVHEFRQRLMQKRQQLLNRAKNVKDDQPDDNLGGIDWAEETAPIGDMLDTLIDEMIENCIQNRYLSDERYRDQWMRLYRSRYGSHRIFFELSQKGVDSTLINERGEWLTDTEMAACFFVWQRKFSKLPETPRETYKQKQFLAQKGFDFDTISSMLKAIHRGEEIETDHLDEIPTE